ncbi:MULTISPECIES: SDR family oxidoreductase [unclassified Mesorhizobium]|uniref:SDR family NAD(P)-dependent oxidoreductase n=1 Tax=unclassified Mesorhizobium TaxID=325217 RepID=UPI0024151371|nr:MULTISPECIES: SDR family oxidoreductase [unclassified Mesorhizobium]MDG4889923.1 SDR family NAD(P)-dependent oxidoreductase [Mesorhizobium sp. WSM4887]MDG4904066.1 SDR family NAD(P)-dependent oxidoreductase [Mesorhizobium sp. WSM4962]MDG4909093.1 SDR family NAD(P)-dependent oxidoreductase [Mesorhizobium sp. WSM4898]MDG4921717.1 SDR family NAD(P)-dependent oxidoreductase [Mesorhizobium sp. WSM4989]
MSASSQPCNIKPVVVVTGGASGIGEATVRRFVAGGWRAVVADINDTQGKSVAAELVKSGADVVYRHLDVSDEAAVTKFADEIWSSHGPVASLVNSGGILQNAVRVTKMEIAEFDRIIDINVRGSLLVGRAFGERMAEIGSGSIINLCSLTSFRPSPQPAYGVSKASMVTLTEIMAAELGPQGVRVNAVAPGYTMTPAMRERINRGERNPDMVISKSAIPRFVEPSDVGEAIFFLCSPAASAITGVVLPIDCGWLVYSAYTAFATQPA